MSNLLAFGKDIVSGGNSSSGGHIIQNASDTNLTQRDTLQFKGGLKATDDSTNEKTVVDGSPTEITWAEYNAMTPEQQQALEHTLVTNVPSADGAISADLMTKLWENSSPTSDFVAQNITLSSSDYDFLLWTYQYNSSNNKTMSQICQKGSGTNMSYVVGGNSRSRMADRTSDTVFSVYDASSAGVVDNSVCIPLTIYGIKKTVNVTFDALAKNVSTLASNCMLSDEVTSVESALNEIKEYITSKVVTLEVDLKAVAKPYFFPKDGYIEMFAPAGGYVALNVKDANNSNLLGFRINATSTDYAQSSIFIRKGLRCNDAVGSSGSSVTYRAL